MAATNFRHRSLTRSVQLPATAMRWLSPRCWPVELHSPVARPLSIHYSSSRYSIITISAHTLVASTQHTPHSTACSPSRPGLHRLFFTPARSCMALCICRYPEPHNLVPTIHRRYQLSRPGCLQCRSLISPQVMVPQAHQTRLQAGLR